MPIEMSTFVICFVLFMLIILVITVNAFKNAPTVDDFEEPYDYSKSDETPEIDPTELFQSMKDVKVDTSQYPEDKAKFEQEDGLFEEFTKTHYCITLSEDEKEKILFALRMLKIQIILHPLKYKYKVDDIEELIVIINYEKWKFEH
jgi:hypothetical protein